MKEKIIQIAPILDGDFVEIYMLTNCGNVYKKKDAMQINGVPAKIKKIIDNSSFEL